MGFLKIIIIIYKYFPNFPKLCPPSDTLLDLRLCRALDACTRRPGVALLCVALACPRPTEVYRGRSGVKVTNGPIF